VEARLREQATLARLGEMAAVITHAVKNPLAGIRGASPTRLKSSPNAARFLKDEESRPGQHSVDHQAFDNAGYACDAKNRVIMEKKFPLRVLVVDDEMLMRWSISETLGAKGHTVVEAPDGAAAVQALADSSATDAILLDYLLPDSSDLSLLTRIRRLAPRTPVVFMTAFGTPTLFKQVLELGAAEVLRKPFDMFALEGIVQRAAFRSPPLI
jgi:CheY-like chemotaxis protein